MAVALACLVLVPHRLQADDDVGFDARLRYRIPLDDAQTRGPSGALVTIVEFSDFNCRYCRSANDTIGEILRLYPRDVRVVYRHSLLDPEDGTLAAEAVMAAADQGRFWPFHDRLFASPGGIDREAVDGFARELGLDQARFSRALDEATFRSAVREDDRQAAALGISGTPMFFINGRPLAGAHSLGTFVALIEEERRVAEEMVARGVARADVYHRVTSSGLPRAEPVAPGAEMPFIPRWDHGGIYPVGLGADSHHRGPKDALVTIVEFGDFLCGFCARVQPTIRALEQIYGDDLRVVYRHLPLGDNPDSRLLAEAALAAGEQGRFAQMHDRLFATHDRLTREQLEAIARDIGLDVAAFNRALDERRYRDTVSFDAAAASRLGVRGTPMFFINGSPISGAKPLETFRTLIDLKLEEAKAQVARGVPREQVYRAVTAPRRE